MKVSKKSLIVSIAVLCVCALSLSAASFAWFSASQSAQVKDLQLSVMSQSDIKIAVNPEAINNADSAYWLTTLDSAAIKAQYAGEYISDVTPNTQDVCDGKFKAPSTADRESIGDDGVFDYEKLAETNSGFYHFKIYIRTTGNTKGVTYNTTGFSLKTTGADVSKTALNAIALGDSTSTTITMGTNTASAVAVVDAADDLTQISDSGYYYTAVDYYIWVEGTHADCKNANALSVFDYANTITFSYGSEFATV